MSDLTMRASKEAPVGGGRNCLLRLLRHHHHFTGGHLAILTMTKHSKNNTASSIFSYAEYKKLDYGTKRVSPHSLWVA